MSQPIDPRVAALFAEEIFPINTDLTVKPLQPRVVPEPPRAGEGGVDCPTCAKTDDDYVWTDDTWRLRPYKPTPVRGLLLLEPRAHIDSFSDFPPPLLDAIGPMIARVEAAILSIGDIA